MVQKSFFIEGKGIGDGHPCLIIAEVGINHQGDSSIARKLIAAASSCKADCVKFQKRTIHRILCKEGLDAPYVNEKSFGATYGEHKRHLEFSEEEFASLKEYAEQCSIIFFASAWDEESADLLERIGVRAFKIASADLTNIPLLKHVARKKKPMLISCGMSTLEEIDRAFETVTQYNDQIALMHCVSTYPCDFNELNLRLIPFFKERYGCPVGFSGHERGTCLGPAVVALGANIIERHFTLDRTMKGSDHAASLEPEDLRRLINDVRHTEEALGVPDKKIHDSEIPIRRKLSKSIVSTITIRAGTVITRDMLTTKGPGTGLSPVYLDKVVSCKAKRDIPADVIIHEEDIFWND